MTTHTSSLPVETGAKLVSTFGRQGPPCEERPLGGGGTNSTTINQALAHLCSAPEEEHEPIQGSNEHGRRSVQKASWTQETCDRIF